MARLKDFQAAVDAWLEVDGRLSQEHNAAQLAGQTRKIKKFAELRTQNDRAYFLLIFARFEQHLNIAVSQFVTRRQASGKWETRRGWDVIQLNNLRRTPFLNRLAYVLDKSSPDFTTIQQYYGIRNSLAHAGTTQTPFAISNVKAQLEQIARSLRS